MVRRADITRLVALALLTIVPFSSGPAAAAERISMRYEIYGFIGIQVLTLHTTLEEDGQRYLVSADYATTGIAGIVVPQSTKAVATSRLGRGTASPETFRNDTRRSGTDRHSLIKYKEDGTVDGSSTPPPHTPVPVADTRGTVDNLTAYLKLERQLATKGTCGMTAPVFDGRHRYDLVFSDVGRQELQPQGGHKYKGTTIACRMVRYNRVVDEAEKNEGAASGTLWYAINMIPGSDNVVPVRMRLDTQIGAVDAYLAEIHGRGVDLKLIE